jgi:hypothetical protein
VKHFSEFLAVELVGECGLLWVDLEVNDTPRGAGLGTGGAELHQ